MRAEAKDQPALDEILTDIEDRIGHIADIGKLK